jgi:hypothetical protein
MKLTKKQIDFLVDFFHEFTPDYDGYLGDYFVPERIMRVYKKKYSKIREWDE